MTMASSYKGFRPLGDRIVIRPDPEPEKVGSIIVPESVRGKGSMRQTCRRGEVLAMGPGMPTLKGGRWPMPDVKPGDKILFFGDGAVKLEWEGEQLVILRDDFVFAEA